VVNKSLSKIEGRAEREMLASACTRSMPGLLYCTYEDRVPQ